MRAASIVVACAALNACASALEEDQPSGPPRFGGALNPLPNNSNNTNNTGMNNGTSQPSGAAGAAPSSVQNPGTGGSASEGINPMIGLAGSNGAGGSTAGYVNPPSGTAGSSTGGAGNGQAPQGGTGGQDTAPVIPPPVIPPPVIPPPVPPPPAGPDIDCPDNAFFCAGFEEAGIPAQARYFSQRGPFVPGDSMVIDSNESFAGSQSLLVPAGGSNFDYRMLSVLVPTRAFWVRLHVLTDVEFGDGNHDTLFSASTLLDGFNGDRSIEFAEQFGQVLLNKNDQLHGPTAPGPPNNVAGSVVTANVWHCMEAFYDGVTGDVLVFRDNVQIITAPGWRPDTYNNFRFGYQRFNTARNVWFDDVVVGPTRIGCN
jgi:hypothetical protein